MARRFSRRHFTLSTGAFCAAMLTARKGFTASSEQKRIEIQPNAEIGVKSASTAP